MTTHLKKDRESRFYKTSYLGFTGIIAREVYGAENHKPAFNGAMGNSLLELSQQSLKAIGGNKNSSEKPVPVSHRKSCRCIGCRINPPTASQSTDDMAAGRGSKGGGRLTFKDLKSKEFTSHTRDVLGENNELLTFYIHGEGGDIAFDDGSTGYSFIHALDEEKFIRSILARLDALIDLDFKEKADWDGSDIDIYCLYSHSGWDEDTVGSVENHGKGLSAYWDLYWMDNSLVDSGSTKFTNYEKNTIVHEIGHVLGLSHPQERPYSKKWNDRDTVMSYNKGGATWNSWFTHSDIKALQRIWGKENDHKDQLHQGKINIANKLFGENGNDKLFGGKKSDTLSGGMGNDIINGGSGRDTAVFSGRSNRINLNTTKWQNTGDGRDRLISIENVNVGGGNDVVTGNKAANTLNGQNGNDSLYGQLGNDTINGGSGRDTAVFSGLKNRINLNTTRWQNTGDGRDRLISIENVNAGGGNDVVTGNKAANTLNGQNGNDVLYGAAGNDRLLGGRGDDRLHGNSGRDYLYGDSGYDQLYGYSGNDILKGGDGNDLLYGGTGFYMKERGTGNDNLFGQGGDDWLYGSDGSDELFGGSGDDHLYGDLGNDKLVGGQGKDKLWGQAGRDTFVLTKGVGHDRIMDFKDGQDRIQLLGSGISTFHIVNRNGHAYIYEGVVDGNKDLLAVVNGAADDLQLKNSFLV
ncbi:Uncharacterized protein wiht hemolysin-type calcium-binding regions [Synechococcus sp. RCC307]|nr:Uncharacterized protein wiht hemolysin-type calcium-binding regions [Synechococcus sp. RCC307]